MTRRSPVGQGFGRTSRIRESRDFRTMRENGKRMVCGCLILNSRRNLTGVSRLGVVTSGKIGGAVVRSRARRLLREAFRLHREAFGQPLDIVLVARQSIVGKSFQQVEVDFLTSLRKAGLLKEGISD